MSRSKRETRDLESGLCFSWRTPESCHWSLLASIVIVALIGSFFLFTLKIRVLSPPRLIERKAQVMLLPSGEEGRSWDILAREAGPFPARFDPAAVLEQSPEIVSALAGGHNRFASYQPQLRGLPEEADRDVIDIALKGERVFPPHRVDDAAASTPPTGPVKFKPELVRLSSIPDGVWPSGLPALEAGIPVAKSSAGWRFMIRVGEDGVVSDCMPLNAAEDAGADVVERWLRAVRFGKKAAAAGWFGVGVTFNREP